MRRVFGATVGTALGLLFVTAPAAAQFLTFVSAAGNDANTCFVQANPCKTLQRAINQTSAGGEVRLLTSLAGNGFINKSITIEGGRNTVIGTIAVNSATAIVRFRRLNLNGRHAFTTGFNLINAAAVHIEECSVERYTADGILLGSGASAELVVANSVSRDNGESGIDLQSPTTAKLTVENSRLENNNSAGIDNSGGRAAISDSVLFGNFVALKVRSGATASFTNSIASASGDTGLVAEDGSEVTLESCEADGNDVGLLVAPGGAKARVSNCVFTANGSGLFIFSAGTALTLGNNLIAGNGTNVNGTLTPLAGE